MAQLVKNPPAMQETWVQSLGGEDLLEEAMATHSSPLAVGRGWGKNGPKCTWLKGPFASRVDGGARCWVSWKQGPNSFYTSASPSSIKCSGLPRHTPRMPAGTPQPPSQEFSSQQMPFFKITMPN